MSGKPQLTKIDEKDYLGDSSQNEWLKVKKSLNGLKADSVTKSKSLFLCADSRSALSKLPKESISCIITSPPYGNLKNYGSPNQIGFGQNWEKEYLPDLEKVFFELFRVAKSGAAMWVVLDMIKDGGEMKPLPWEVINRARQAGWTFHDLVIWDKGKSLPWSNPGRFRGVCEYILLLGKGKLTNFNIDAVRDSENLSSYWVKYPERYHPDGKAPSDLWHFPIPTQGTWANKQYRHYCPFPIGLVARMISISSKPKDIVLDPFSGTGSVIAISSYLNRFGVGVEINEAFVKDYEKIGYDLLIEKSEAEIPNKNISSNSLRSTIIELRMLKFAKTLFTGIGRADQLNKEAHEFVGGFLLKSANITKQNKTKNLSPGNLGKIELQILLKEGADKNKILKSIEEKINTAPLSIFGIKANVEIITFESWNVKDFTKLLKETSWYVYRKGKFYDFDKKIKKDQLIELLKKDIEESTKYPIIFSTLKQSLNSY